MLKNIIKKLGLSASILIINAPLHAASGLFFDVQSSGDPANIAISLCLDGVGPVSCQNYTVKGLEIAIKTQVPTQPSTYPQAGIKIITPGYRIVDVDDECELWETGYCLFETGNSNDEIQEFELEANPGSGLYNKANVPGSMAVDGNNTSMYMIGKTPNEITNCDLDNNGLVIATSCQTSKLNFSPSSIAVNSAGTRAYILEHVQGKIFICSILDNKVDAASCVDAGANIDPCYSITLNSMENSRRKVIFGYSLIDNHAGRAEHRWLCEHDQRDYRSKCARSWLFIATG